MENNNNLNESILYYERVLAHVNSDNTAVYEVKEGTVGSFKEVLDRVINGRDVADKVNRACAVRVGQMMSEDVEDEDKKEKV